MGPTPDELHCFFDSHGYIRMCGSCKGAELHNGPNVKAFLSCFRGYSEAGCH